LVAGRKISRSKSRPAATFKAQAFLSISKTSLPTSPVRPGSWPCGWFNRDRRGRKGHGELRSRNVSHGGLSLDVGSQVGIPDQFTLIVVAEKKTYSCNVVWRRGQRIGVVFC
jgi:hypothetical protein